MLVCVGGGFNGADGCVAARHLANAGVSVEVWSLSGSAPAAREYAWQWQMLRALHVPVHHGAPTPRHAAQSHWIIDGLLGIGLRARVREPYASAIRILNASETPIVAVDVPSGLDADTGQVCGVAVRASATVTFGLAKRGLLRSQAAPYVGRLFVDPIGFPAHLLSHPHETRTA